MPIQYYVERREPPEDAEIWRFMDMRKFRDLIETSELYFCRADRFKDKSECLPPDACIRALQLDPLDLRDRQTLNNALGSARLTCEQFYVNCWHLWRQETGRMWKDYGHDGVAICSRYGLLKSTLDALADRVYLGLVHYSSDYSGNWNYLRFITTKRPEYAEEKEVRAFIWSSDVRAGINRHVDINNIFHAVPPPPPKDLPDSQRHKVDLHALITKIVVTPWASASTFTEVSELARNRGYTVPVLPSDFTRHSHWLPTPHEFNNLAI